MNRTLLFLVAAVIVGLFATARADAQVTLVVGSVRDQHGAAVAGAMVSAQLAGGRSAVGSSEADGTFALAGEGARTVTIRCRYCAPLTLPVADGEPVVAIVHRFDALFDDSPSTSDLANLPYAHVESAVALRPFTLLRQSSTPLPGSQLSDRGLAPNDALLIDAGVPDYDMVFGVSPYGTIPAAYEQRAALISAGDAFLYGDRAGSGIVTLDPFGGDNADVALAGGDKILRLQTGSDYARLAAGTYSNTQESRQRADGALRVPLSTAQTLAFSGGMEQGRQYGMPDTLANAFSFARAAFDDAQPAIDLHADLVADRGAYAALEEPYHLSDQWSDADLTAGVRTRGAVQLFADISDRLSTGIYDVYAYKPTTRIAGTLTQDRFDAGVEASGSAYDVTAGVGLFNIGFTGGVGGVSTPQGGRLATPSIQLHLFPAANWSLDVSGSGSYTLPTLWQQYGYREDYTGLTYDRNALYAAALTYSDLSRVKVSVEGASQRVAGYTNGDVTSAGLSIAWQVAPLLALRAWSMHVTDTTASSGQTPPYPGGINPSVDALWLTYDNNGALRADLIYRRDLLDNQGFEHFDGDVSGPISSRLRWYAGLEDRQRTTYVDAGLRFAP